MLLFLQLQYNLNHAAVFHVVCNRQIKMMCREFKIP